MYPLIRGTEGMTGMYTAAIGDLHLGNVNADILSFLHLLRKIKYFKDMIKEIVLVGDFLDGLDKYSTQQYKQYPQTLEVQRNLLKWLIELLLNEFPSAKLILVLGNHEADFKGVLFDKEMLEDKYDRLEVKREHIDGNKMLFIHQLGRGTRFGSQSGWTPSTVARALAEITSLEHRTRMHLSGLVTAHVHKTLDILQVNGYNLILLPSFLKTGYETAEDKMYQPAIVLIDHIDEHLWYSVYYKKFEPLEKVVHFNDILVSLTRANYKKYTTLEKALEITKLY